MGEQGDFPVCPGLGRPRVAVLGDHGWRNSVDRRRVEHGAQLLELVDVVFLGSDSFARDDLPFVLVEDALHCLELCRRSLGFKVGPLQFGLHQVGTEGDFLAGLVAVVVPDPHFSVLPSALAPVHARRQVAVLGTSGSHFTLLSRNQGSRLALGEGAR
ncbi:hypothetical protein D3C79_870440 [compost metagenome]